MSDDDSEEEIYSITSSKTVYRRSRSRPSIAAKSSVPKIVVHSEEKNYYPVTRWAVDYNNKNYVRSKLNKNKGLHRKIKGRPPDWQVEYDNSYFLRSKVNAPKGLHRGIPDIKRKYVPDDDELADATGWEFDYGPEFDQEEQDVTYIPEGRIVARGCYRWHGTKRNDSDFDWSDKEQQDNILNEELEEELKYGPEFLQADVPHMAEQLERKYSRGAFRFYEVQRNAYDIRPEELDNAQQDPEWRRKHHSNGFRYQDLEMCRFDHDEESDHHIAKGKPFRRTILNKIYELRKRNSVEEGRYGTRLSLVPGEGEKTLYEGRPDRFPFKTKNTPDMRSVFRRPERRRTSREEKEYEYEERRERDLKPEYARRLHKMADARRRPSRRSSYEEFENKSKSRSGEKAGEYAYTVEMMNEPRKRHSKAVAESSSLSDSAREDLEIWREKAEKKKKNHPGEVRAGKWKSKNHDKRAAYEEKEYSKERKSKQDFSRRNIVVEKRSSGTRRNSDRHSRKRKGSSSRNKLVTQDEMQIMTRDKDETLKKWPPHVEERVREIRKKMEEKIESHDEHDAIKMGRLHKSLSDIDLMKHKSHPKDRGQMHNEEYEKYITKNGSEIWIKKEEKFSELHHKSF